MTFRHTLMSMTAAAALLGAPLAAQAQQGGSASGSSSTQSTTTQTTPQQGPLSSTTGAQSGATPGGTGPTTGPTTGQNTMPRDASGGVLAQDRSTTTPRDGTPGNPPSTATQRAADSLTGDRTPADGTPGNPPGTAGGRAVDRALGTNTTGTNPSGTATTTTGTTTTGMPAGRTGATATGATAGAMAVDSAVLRSGRRVSKIIGADIYNENNESIGEIEDLLIPQAAGGMGSPVAVISVGGFLGIGAKLVAVPYERLQLNTERNRWMLSGATKESLSALPTFNYDAATTDRRG